MKRDQSSDVHLKDPVKKNLYLSTFCYTTVSALPRLPQTDLTGPSAQKVLITYLTAGHFDISDYNRPAISEISTRIVKSQSMIDVLSLSNEPPGIRAKQKSEVMFSFGADIHFKILQRLGGRMAQL